MAGGRNRVLIVDDDPDLGFLVKAALSKHGFSCTIAPSFVEGRRLIEQTTFDYLIVDLILSDGYGLDLAPSLCQGPNQSTPFIIASGNVSLDVRKHPRVTGAFQKPYDLTALVRFMEAGFDGHGIH